MLGKLKLTRCPQNKAPNYPIISIMLVLCHALPDFAHCLDQVALLKLSKSPVSMRVVPMSVEFLGLSANLNRVAIQLVHVVKEGQIVVCVRVVRLQLHNSFEVLHCLGVHFSLEIG